MEGRFGRVLCAMVTPFRESGEIDIAGAVSLATYLAENGNDGLVLTGTTGESPTISDEEKVELWSTVSREVSVPVIAGTGTAGTSHSVAMTTEAKRAGAAGILVVTPYYNRPSQAGISVHMRAVAEAAEGLPVLLYDIPVRTGRAVDLATVLSLAEDGVIAGVKDATGNPARSAELVRSAPEGFDLYSGNDGDTLPLLSIGAVGVISVEAHWAGSILRDMVSAYRDGDVDRALSLNQTLIPSHRYQASDAAPNPVPTKTMLRVMGLPGGGCRPPMGPEPEGLEDQARQVLAELRGATVA